MKFECGTQPVDLLRPVLFLLIATVMCIWFKFTIPRKRIHKSAQLAR